MKIFGKHDDNTLEQISDVDTRAERTALMADGHLGYIMPIGGVAAYDNQVPVAGVGFDIACGNAAIRTDLKLEKIGADDIPHIADEIFDSIDFGVGRTNTSDDAPVNDPLFDHAAWDSVPKQQREGLKNKARAQLGTVGSGNHYVDVFSDENGYVWVGVHFGSRGFGHTIASGFMSEYAGEKWGKHVKETETLLDLDTEIGERYWDLMCLAGTYAYVGREWVARKVVALLGGTELELIHNHHNFAWVEEHGGSTYIVVRKGATPAFPGQKGFVGGSMGDDAVIIEGANTDTDEQRAAMYSTVHGAGRVMSRTQAKGKINRKTGEVKVKGLVTAEMMREWIDGYGVTLRGGGLDESPHAYRRLPDVLRDQGDTINILHTLRPFIVAMAGANEFDPYKD